MRYKPKTHFTFPFKNNLFSIHLYGNDQFQMFGISFLKFTLWFENGARLKKSVYGQWVKAFEIGFSNYYKHEYKSFIII